MHMSREVADNPGARAQVVTGTLENAAMSRLERGGQSGARLTLNIRPDLLSLSETLEVGGHRFDKGIVKSADHGFPWGEPLLV